MSEEELVEKMDEKLCYASSINIPAVEDLFHSIDNYVKSNYLCEEDEDKYYLKYKNRMLLCGYYVGPEILYYLKLVKEEYADYYVDYEDLKNNRINSKQQVIKDEIDDINLRILLLEEKGVSRRLIKKSINI